MDAGDAVWVPAKAGTTEVIQRAFSLVKSRDDPCSARLASFLQRLLGGSARSSGESFRRRFNFVQHYQDPSIYLKIILPGAVAGMAIGYGTVRFGKPTAPKERV